MASKWGLPIGCGVVAGGGGEVWFIGEERCRSSGEEVKSTDPLPLG